MAFNFRPDGRPPTVTGPMTLIRIPGLDGDDGIIGRGQNWNLNEDFNPTGIPEFGKHGPQEYAIVDYRATGNIALFRILTLPYENLRKDGRPFIPERSQIGRSIPIDIDFVTRADADPPDTPIYIATFCICGGKEISTTANGTMGFNTRWAIVEVKTGEA